MKTPTLQDPSVQYDWEKHASAVLSTPEIERAFGDQAYSRCAQRAQKLMQPPYFLGFEMIYANEDKTRLVGIFAFRINKDLIYIPSFFLNGQVKGQELLYQVKQKKMKPCTEEWISYLMEKAISEPGMGIARTRLDRLNTGTDLKPLIMPMRNKIASSMGNSEFIKLAREEHGQEAGQFVEDAFTRALAFEDMLEKRAKYGPSPSPSGKVPEVPKVPADPSPIPAVGGSTMPPPAASATGNANLPQRPATPASDALTLPQPSAVTPASSTTPPSGFAPLDSAGANDRAFSLPVDRNAANQQALAASLQTPSVPMESNAQMRGSSGGPIGNLAPNEQVDYDPNNQAFSLPVDRNAANQQALADSLPAAASPAADAEAKYMADMQPAGASDDLAAYGTGAPTPSYLQQSPVSARPPQTGEYAPSLPFNPNQVSDADKARFHAATLTPFNPKSPGDVASMQKMLAGSPTANRRLDSMNTYTPAQYRASLKRVPNTVSKAPMAPRPMGGGGGGTRKPRTYGKTSRPPHTKLSAGFIPRMEKEASDWWTSYVGEMLPVETTNPFKSAGALREYLVTDGKRPACLAIHGALTKSAAFAEALMTATNGDMDQFLPAEALEITQVKKAAYVPQLVMHFGGVKNASVTPALYAQTVKHGFSTTDVRPSDELTAVYEDAHHSMESVTGNGVYEMPSMDGKNGKVIAATPVELCGIGNTRSSIFNCHPGSSTQSLAFIFTSPVNTMKRIEVGAYVGKVIPEEQAGVSSVGVESPTAGKAYVIYNPKSGNCADTAVFISGVIKNPSGTKTLICNSVDTYRISGYGEMELLLNPDAPKCDWQHGILNGEVRFIEMDLEEIPENVNHRAAAGGGSSLGTVEIPCKRLVAAPSLMPQKVVWDSLLYGKLFKGQISMLDESGKIALDFGGRKYATVHTKAAAVAFLAGGCHIAADAAMELVGNVASGKSVSFIMQPQEKHAMAVTRLIDRPRFTEGYDSEVMAREQEPQSFELGTRTDAPPIRRISINEVHDPSMGGSMNSDRHEIEDHIGMEDMLTKDPMQLADIQKSQNLPNVFEHKLIGSLIKTFDASASMDRYIPKMEEGLDAVGRALFLFFWKPQDFEKAYGQDDTPEIEQELISNFKSFGDMVLNLMRKSPNADQGSAPLA